VIVIITMCDDREEAKVQERFLDAVMALRDFIGEQCGATNHNLRIVLDDDLATEVCDCEADEEWQMFAYGLSRLSIDGEFVCIEYGTKYYPSSWMFRTDVGPFAASFQINVHNMVLGGVARSTIVTLERVWRE
jgi:hypothetical protein